MNDALRPFYANALINTLRDPTRWTPTFAPNPHKELFGFNMFGSVGTPRPAGWYVRVTITEDDCGKPIRLEHGGEIYPEPATITLTDKAYGWARRDLYERRLACAVCGIGPRPKRSTDCKGVDMCILRHLITSSQAIFKRGSVGMIPQDTYGFRAKHADAALTILSRSSLIPE